MLTITWTEGVVEAVAVDNAAPIDDVRALETEAGSGYDDVLSWLAHGVLPIIAWPHFVNPEGLDF